MPPSINPAAPPNRRQCRSADCLARRCDAEKVQELQRLFKVLGTTDMSIIVSPDHPETESPFDS